MADNIATESLRFGKHPPKKDYRTFLFENYLKDDVPAPPSSLSVLTRVYNNLHENNPSVLFPMYANDRLGDCTIAAVGHANTVHRGMISQREILPEDLIVRIYNHLTGGNDTGLAMMDVLEYLRKNIVAGDTLVAYVSVNPYNHVHVKQAMMLFGGLFVGFQVQEKCIEEFRARTPWKPGRLINSGHAIFTTDYTPEMVNSLTWGTTQWGTWEWWDKCVDEAFVMLVPEAKDPKFAPGFDFEKLQKDLIKISEYI